MSTILSHAIGDAFDFAVDWLPDAGAPATVEQFEITSQVRTLDGVLLADLAITKYTNFMGWNALALDTSTWPVGHAEWDFKCVVAGRTVHSSTVLVQVTKTITK